MDLLTFTAQLFSSIAWPIAAVVVALLLRQPLAGVLNALRRIKVSGVEAEFGRRLEQARELIDDEPRTNVPPLTSPAYPDKNREFLLKLAEHSPRSVILEAWRGIETAATKALSRTNGDIKSARGLSSTVTGKALVNANLIDDTESQLFSILRDLRNRAAHEQNFNLAQDEALEYAILAQRLSSNLENRTQGKSA